MPKGCPRATCPRFYSVGSRSAHVRSRGPTRTTSSFRFRRAGPPSSTPPRAAPTSGTTSRTRSRGSSRSPPLSSRSPSRATSRVSGSQQRARTTTGQSGYDAGSTSARLCAAGGPCRWRRMWRLWCMILRRSSSSRRSSRRSSKHRNRHRNRSSSSSSRREWGARSRSSLLATAPPSHPLGSTHRLRWCRRQSAGGRAARCCGGSVARTAGTTSSSSTMAAPRRRPCLSTRSGARTRRPRGGASHRSSR
mmetsp:Transcript_21565/g.53217  ORF Transcript_21565/g.53217 Transcript_21565/m.53217 type:complete len:249 (+) Transcript_21565:894-1640(+)